MCNTANTAIAKSDIEKVEEMIKDMVVQSVLQSEILLELETTDVDRVLRCYFKIQTTLV